MESLSKLKSPKPFPSLATVYGLLDEHLLSGRLERAMVMDCLKSLSGSPLDDRQLQAVFTAGLPADEAAAHRLLLDLRLGLVDEFSRSEETLDDLRSISLLYQLVRRHVEGSSSAAELKSDFGSPKPQ